MKRRNRTETIRVILSLDPATDGVLEYLAHIGLFGKSKARVAATIIGNWIWDNEEKLNRQGIRIQKKNE